MSKETLDLPQLDLERPFSQGLIIEWGKTYLIQTSDKTIKLQRRTHQNSGKAKMGIMTKASTVILRESLLKKEDGQIRIPKPINPEKETILVITFNLNKAVHIGGARLELYQVNGQKAVFQFESPSPILEIKPI